MTAVHTEGSVENYTKRCINALLSMESDVVFWPDLEERKEIARRIENRRRLPSCIGFVDGTLFPLEYKPELDGAVLQSEGVLCDFGIGGLR